MLCQWPLWQEFLQEGDVVLAETGTSSFGILDVRFPAKTDLLTQVSDPFQSE